MDEAVVVSRLNPAVYPFSMLFALCRSLRRGWGLPGFFLGLAAGWLEGIWPLLIVGNDRRERLCGADPEESG